jgi:NAD(P)-dependent dehydrogenase (short-subunit alcohol dehydrogenase family)
MSICCPHRIMTVRSLCHRVETVDDQPRVSADVRLEPPVASRGQKGKPHMELTKGNVAVVTGAASGIGLGLADRFAAAGCNVVLADVDAGGLSTAAAQLASGHGIETLEVVCDVSKESSVQALASRARDRFGAVQVVCNNAGVQSSADHWTGPLSAWNWVMGVNFWGVVHGVRAFLPAMIEQGGGYIVNTASIAGLLPGFSASYDASKHAVVAITEDLYRTSQQSGWNVGVSVLCPGWVRTGIMDSGRNWPSELGEQPEGVPGSEVVAKYVRRAVAEGTTPAAVADLVFDALKADRFWVFPHPDFVELAVSRWQDIAEGLNPVLFREVPGLPPLEELVKEMLEGL